MSDARACPVFTIGHSRHELSVLLHFLKAHSITAVADVRSQPYSRLHPQFNREHLKNALKAAGIAYVFLGRELGARSEDQSCYINGKVQYDSIAKTAPFRRGIERILHGSKTHTITLLCAERDPLTCHRTILVGRVLVEKGILLRHIRENGCIEEHKDAIARLLRETGLYGPELFRSHTEVERDAYAKRAAEIAYQSKEGLALPMESK